MSTNGGSTTTSTASSCFSVRLNASFWVSEMASRWLRFIFQLPAMRGRRVSGVGTRLRLQRLNTGEDLALEGLHGGPATGGDVAPCGPVQPPRPYRRRRV